jgi:signal peptidase I
MTRGYATRHNVLGTEPKGRSSTQDRPEEGKKEGHRETVEAIVVAMILALLVRGFEAEAFVIPTGSMAPTLMGRHKEVVCPQCKYVYTINASAEDDGGRQLGIGGLRLPAGDGRPTSMVVAGTCVNCRYQARGPVVEDAPSFNGDRILVMKFPYEMPFLPGSSNPRRWDVVVFRYPEEPEVSYIKRLVGLPGEELRIQHGDIFIKPPGGKEFRLERKPLAHQRAMSMMVYDDRHRPAAMWDKPEWRRWRPTAAGEWNESIAGGEFSTAGTAGKEVELRYHHLVPDPEQWDALLSEHELPRPPRPTLITDFYSYNTNVTGEVRGAYDSSWRQPDWVGDLSLSAKLQVKEARGVVRFELVEGGVANRCEIDLAEGTATLYHGATRLNAEKSRRFLNGPGTHDVTFANFDDRLTLVVDGKGVFGDGLLYDDERAQPLPTTADLAPAGITSIGAAVTVSDLVLKRDIYYTLNPGHSDYESMWEDHFPQTAVELFDNLADPSRFSFLTEIQPKDFPIGKERFLMLGDNSPMSKDSRGWSNLDRRDLSIKNIEDPGAGWDTSDRAYWEVPRELLTGKAFFIYWPHGKPVGPDIRLSRDFRIPFIPYVQRMKWIR